MQKNIVTVIGGTGFVGRHVVKHLARAGYVVNVVSRTPDQAHDLKVLGPIGKVVLSKGNIRNIDSIKPYLKGNFAVIDLVGILYESGAQKFSSVQDKAAGELAKAAKESGVAKFIYMSALGVDKAITSKYAKSKLHGEKAVFEAFSEAIILRPSLMFGPGDGFFGKFASLARFLPMLPLIGGGKTLFQPVYVEDVAAAIIKTLSDHETGGKIYQLGGPKVYSFAELLKLMLAELKKKRILLEIPFPIAFAKAFFLQLLPKPLLTVDQVRLLKYDNIISEGNNGLEILGIKPHHLETVLPDILLHFRKRK